jgi:putative DNA primase/helicase
MILLTPMRETRQHYFKSRGTLDEWKHNIARYCSGNSRLLFAVSCATAAPLLPLVGEPSGGFHLFGTTSKGKTTISMVAGSFLGGGGSLGFVESLLTTANALENTAESHNNALLLLDELKLIDPEQASKVAYSLSTGRAQGRMDRTNSQCRPEWTLLYLSNGELNLESHIAATRKRIYGGQEVRLCSIPARVDETNGTFESIHHFETAKHFSEYLVQQTGQYFGEASKAYLRQLVRIGDGKILERAQHHRREFNRRYLSGNLGADIARAGNRFSLVAAGGEPLTELHISRLEARRSNSRGRQMFRGLDSRAGRR